MKRNLSQLLNTTSVFNFPFEHRDIVVCYCHLLFSFPFPFHCIYAVVGKQRVRRRKVSALETRDFPCRRKANLPFQGRPSVEPEWNKFRFVAGVMPVARLSSTTELLQNHSNGKFRHFLGDRLVLNDAFSFPLWGLIKNQWVIIGVYSLKYCCGDRTNCVRAASEEI